MPWLIWLAGKIGVGKAVVVVGAAVLAIGLVGGAWLKGYSSCASKFELEAAHAEIRNLKQQIADKEEAENFGRALAELMEKTEKENEKIASSVVGPATADCVDVGFLRRLDKLR